MKWKLGGKFNNFLINKNENAKGKGIEMKFITFSGTSGSEATRSTWLHTQTHTHVS